MAARGARFALLLTGVGAMAWTLGVIPALPLFVLLYMWVEGVKPLTALAVAVGTGAATYLVFVRLRATVVAAVAVAGVGRAGYAEIAISWHRC